MTSILIGNRFMYAKPLQNGESLIYQKGQPSKKQKPKFTNCWGEHWWSKCSDQKRCRICLKTDHEPGSEESEAFVENHKHVVSFAGADNPIIIEFLSLYHTCFLEYTIVPHSTLFNMLNPFAAEISQRLQLYRQHKWL